MVASARIELTSNHLSGWTLDYIYFFLTVASTGIEPVFDV